MKNKISSNEVIANHSLNTTSDVPTHPHVKCFKCGCEIPADPKISLLENYKEFALNYGPYDFGIKLTMDETTANSICNFAISVLEQVKNEINKDWLDGDPCEMNFLEGIACVESHTGDASLNTIHILLKRFETYGVHILLDLDDVITMFEKTVGYFLFKNKCKIHSTELTIQYTLDYECAIEYYFKKVWKSDLSNVKTLALLDVVPSQWGD